MNKKYLVIPVLLLFLAVLLLSSLPGPVTANPIPRPSPPAGQIIIYGTDAADVLSQGVTFAQECGCYIHSGELISEQVGAAQLVLKFTTRPQ